MLLTFENRVPIMRYEGAGGVASFITTDEQLHFPLISSIG